MDPIAKQILNSLRCPICKSQIDLLDWKNPTGSPKYNFSCAADWQHYRLFFQHWDYPYRIEYETVWLFEGRFLYSVTQKDGGDTEITLLDIDPENRILDGQKDKKPSFTYNKHLFDFTNTNRDKLLNRLHTILVFQ